MGVSLSAALGVAIPFAMIVIFLMRGGSAVALVEASARQGRAARAKKAK